MARVLLIGNESATIRQLGRLLAGAGHESASASTGPPGTWAANGHHPHLAIIDLDSLKEAGIDVLRSVREVDAPPACVVTASSLSFNAVVLAFRSGAADCLVLPVRRVDLLNVVDRLTRYSAGVPHDLVRLVDRAVMFLESEHDAHSQRLFGSAVGLSRGRFRNWCASADIGCKPCLMFIRGLRAVYRHIAYPSETARNLLDNRRPAYSGGVSHRCWRNEGRSATEHRSLPRTPAVSSQSMVRRTCSRTTPHRTHSNRRLREILRDTRARHRVCR